MERIALDKATHQKERLSKIRVMAKPPSIISIEEGLAAEMRGVDISVIIGEVEEDWKRRYGDWDGFDL
jgi:hypothetical protein